MQVVVNGGRGTENINTKLLLMELQKWVNKPIVDLPKEFENFTFEFNDGETSDGVYNYSLKAGCVELKGIGKEFTLTYTNKDGEKTSITYHENKLADVMESAVGLAIFGKVFEYFGKSIRLLGIYHGYIKEWSSHEQILWLIDNDGYKYMLGKRFYMFHYELFYTIGYGKYKGKSIRKLLENNGKEIYKIVEKSINNNLTLRKGA